MYLLKIKIKINYKVQLLYVILKIKNMKDLIIKLTKDALSDYVFVDMPEITIASTGQKYDVIEMAGVRNANSFTLTVRPRKTEDAECEIINPKQCPFDTDKINQRLIELGALEDAEFEVTKK